MFLLLANWDDYAGREKGESPSPGSSPARLLESYSEQVKGEECDREGRLLRDSVPRNDRMDREGRESPSPESSPVEGGEHKERSSQVASACVMASLNFFWPWERQATAACATVSLDSPAAWNHL